MVLKLEKDELWPVYYESYMGIGVDAIIPDSLWNKYKTALDDFLMVREELAKYLQDNDAGH